MMTSSRYFSKNFTDELCKKIGIAILSVEKTKDDDGNVVSTRIEVRSQDGLSLPQHLIM